jgi:outer membrane lipoprotein-sorting protein
MRQPRGLQSLFVGVIVVALAAGASAAGDAGNVNAALKKVTKATKGLRGIVAEVEYAEIVRKRSIGGTGTLYVHMDGWIRAEIGGDSPRVVLLTPLYLYEHRISEKTVEVYNVTSNPHRLAQYVLLGFSPAGSAMKKLYTVELVRNATLDEREVLCFLLTPKSKEVAKAIARIQLWVDPETGVPLKQQIVHATAETDLEIRYLSVSDRGEMENSLFVPKWPEGTNTVRMD